MTTKAKKGSKAKVKIDPMKKLKTELKTARAEVNRLLEESRLKTETVNARDEQIVEQNKEIARLEQRDQENIKLIEKLTGELNDLRAPKAPPEAPAESERLPNHAAISG